MELVFLRLWALLMVLVGAGIFFMRDACIHILKMIRESRFVWTLVIIIYLVLFVGLVYEVYYNFYWLHLFALIDVGGALYIFVAVPKFLDVFRVYLLDPGIKNYGIFITFLGAIILILL